MAAIGSGIEFTCSANCCPSTDKNQFLYDRFTLRIQPSLPSSGHNAPARFEWFERLSAQTRSACAKNGQALS